MNYDHLDRDAEALISALQIMAADVAAAGRLPEQVGDTPFARRVYIRAAAALIDGNLNLIALAINAAVDRGEISLSPEDAELVTGKRTTVDSAGRSTTRRVTRSLEDRLAKLLEIYAGCWDGSYSLDKSTSDWPNFREALDIRDRLTHPKDAESFSVSDHDLKKVERAREWYAASVETMLAACTQARHEA